MLHDRAFPKRIGGCGQLCARLEQWHVPLFLTRSPLSFPHISPLLNLSRRIYSHLTWWDPCSFFCGTLLYWYGGQVLILLSVQLQDISVLARISTVRPLCLTAARVMDESVTYLTQREAAEIDETLMGPLGFSVDQLMVSFYFFGYCITAIQISS